MPSTRRSLYVLAPSLALGLLVVAVVVTVVTIRALGISPQAVALPALRAVQTVLTHLRQPIVDQCPGSLPGGC
jgi:hypothetical protein